MTARLLASPPECVLFDLDGTLLDTEPLYTDAAQAVVGRYGKVYDWSIKKHVVGGQAQAGAAYTIAQLGLPLTVDEYLSQRNAVLHELFANVPPMLGAVALVHALHAAGARLAIATSSERALCDRKLAPHPWKACFEVIVCADDPGVLAAKPAPDLFLVAARALRVAPERCLVVEDAPNGIKAARAANMPVIAVVDPNMRGQDYSGALAQLDSLEQLTPAALGFSSS
jgi:pseudouridine 5'-phosphatase